MHDLAVSRNLPFTEFCGAPASLKKLTQSRTGMSTPPEFGGTSQHHDDHRRHWRTAREWFQARPEVTRGGTRAHWSGRRFQPACSIPKTRRNWRELQSRSRCNTPTQPKRLRATPHDDRLSRSSFPAAETADWIRTSRRAQTEAEQTHGRNHNNPGASPEESRSQK